VLLCDDDDEEGDPVAHNCEEVGENLHKVFTASNASDRISDKYNKRPEEARDLREGAAESLDGERRGVGANDVVGAAVRLEGPGEATEKDIHD
jgi:hypothetical protein